MQSYERTLGRLQCVVLDTVPDDQPAELSPLSFGNLAHHVLEDFGQSDLTGSTDVDAIREFLQNAAGQQADRVHGLRVG